MKANELMAGDLVQYNGVVCRVYGLELPFPRKNERFNNKAIIHLWHNGFIDALEEEVFPIPLTAEILEKNEFINKLLVININTENGLLYVDNKGSFAIEILFHNKAAVCMAACYVHELQHALRLCGLNNLADNFKI